MLTETRETFGIPLPPGFLVTWDADVIVVHCRWCGLVHLYSMAGYHVNVVQADALYHRVDCHTPRRGKGGAHDVSASTA